MAKGYFRYGYVHTTPLLGTFWSMLAQTYLEPKTLRRTFDYYKFWLTMSRSPEKVWYYFFSKRQISGSFGGDGYLNYEQCQLSTATIMLSTPKLNLLLQGNKKRNWLSDTSASTTLKFINKYHAFYATELLKKGDAFPKTREGIIDALMTYKKGAQIYKNYDSGKKCLARLNKLKARIGHKNANKAMARVDADVYFDYLEILEGRVSKDLKTKILKMVVKDFDNLDLKEKELELLDTFDQRKIEYDQKAADKESGSSSSQH